MRDNSGISMVNITTASQKRLNTKAIAVPARQHMQKKWAVMTAFTVLALIVSTFVSAEENLYAKNYKAQNANGLTSSQGNPDTKMYVSNHKEDDNISMLEDGYDMMGSSGFEGGDVPAELALTHGKAIKADVVLVYSKYGSAKSASSKMEMIRQAAKTGKELTEKDMADEPTVYKYYASYWAKLPAPTLGVHVIKLVPKSTDPEERSEIPGLQLLAVIKDSPAAKAGLVRGDRLTKINNVKLEKPEDLTSTVRQLRGQTVDLQYLRADTELSTKAQLN
ncbi:MAG: PDZ domain-containing protein [Methylophilaceae bacterium 17-44-8]|nr:MAG: PDZ domain-containing protein [Methylophilaceae bacterium 17-44-8]